MAGQRLAKLEADIKNGLGISGGGKPDSFSGGGTTNLAEEKFKMAEGVTSEDLGTIGANKAVKFIQEYSSKLTEVNTETKKVGGNINPGEGIISIETKGAPDVNTVVTGDFEKVIMNLQAVAEDEVSRQNIPRKYREHLKKYFDSLREGKD